MGGGGVEGESHVEVEGGSWQEKAMLKFMRGGGGVRASHVMSVWLLPDPQACLVTQKYLFVTAYNWLLVREDICMHTLP